MFPKEVDLWFDWHLTNRCNFFCDYCHPQIRHVLNRENLDEPSPAQISSAFERIGKTCGILMSGGEPFAFPDFVELCEMLTKQNYIAINTNLALAQPIGEFVRRVSPKRTTRILAAVHIGERTQKGIGIDEFAANYRLLSRAGFDIIAVYVLHPTLLGQAVQDFENLRELGVDRLVGKVFKGVWNKRRFPIEYSPAELEVVTELIGDYRVGKAYLDRRWNFNGLPCRAGVRSFKVLISGEVLRCASARGSMGNLWEGNFSPYPDTRDCDVNFIRVLSECSEHLVNLPSDFVEMLEKRADNDPTAAD